MRKRMRCRHCRADKVAARGLCRDCFIVPDIRDRYPVVGLAAENRSERSPRARKTRPEPQPTDVQPGPAKVEVLRLRHANGQQLWSDGDAKSSDPSWLNHSEG